MKLRSGRILNYDSSKSTTSQLPVTDVPSTPSSSNSSSNHPLPTSTSSTGSSLSPSSSNPDSTPSSTPSTPPSSNSSPITACGNCDTCKKGHLNTDPVYFNCVTGEEFVVTENLNCNSSGIIYLITCADPNCPLQYIGQTINPLRKRCSGHRSGLRTGNEPTFVRHHFTKVHNPSDLRIEENK